MCHGHARDLGEEVLPDAQLELFFQLAHALAGPKILGLTFQPGQGIGHAEQDLPGRVALRKAHRHGDQAGKRRRVQKTQIHGLVGNELQERAALAGNQGGLGPEFQGSFLEGQARRGIADGFGIQECLHGGPFVIRQRAVLLQGIKGGGELATGGKAKQAGTAQSCCLLKSRRPGQRGAGGPVLVAQEDIPNRLRRRADHDRVGQQGERRPAFLRIGGRSAAAADRLEVSLRPR